MSFHNKRSILIIGGGISGLSIAYFLRKAGLTVTLYEASSRLGGMIDTKTSSWGKVETAANAFIDSDRLRAISKDIKVELIGAKKESRKRYIYVNQRSSRWPLSIGETFSFLWKIFSIKRMKPKQFEVLYSWGIRALGVAATHKILSPALQGIYAGRIKEMSASLVLSRFFDSKKKPQNVKARSVAPMQGMHEWICGLEKWLINEGTHIHLSKHIEPGEVTTLKQNFDAVVIATNAHSAAKLLSVFSPKFSRELIETVEMLPLTKITSFYEPNKSILKGFGVLFAPDEGVKPLGVLFDNFIFEGRSFFRSETWIIPGVGHSEEDLNEAIKKAQEKLYGDLNLNYLGSVKTEWPTALPHYTIELERFLDQKDNLALLKKDNIFLIGNYLGKIGLTQIVDQAFELAEELSSV